jgi:diaminopimelate decarboxylase
VGVRVCPRDAWSGQFGEPIEGGAALRALEEACATPELELVALHAHAGSPLRRPEQVRAHARPVLELAELVRLRCGVELQVLDFGGSLALPTVARPSALAHRLNRALGWDLPRPEVRATLTAQELAALLLAEVNTWAERSGRAAPRVILEPGRALSGDAQLLLCRVHGLRSGADGRPYALLDAGINLAEAAKHEFHQLFAVAKADRPREHRYRLAGPICTPADVLYESWRLPKLEVGDVLAIMDAGAYFVPFATSFSFPQPAVVSVEGGRVTLERRAERYEDLVALDAPPEPPAAAKAG